jgi:hypothetical protein
MNSMLHVTHTTYVIHTCTYINIHYTHMYISIYIYMRIYIYIYIYTYIRRCVGEKRGVGGAADYR